MSGTTCIQMNLMKVRLFQHPISCIIFTSTPARNMAMAAPNLMEKEKEENLAEVNKEGGVTTEGDEEKEKEETLGGGGKGGSAASAIDVINP